MDRTAPAKPERFRAPDAPVGGVEILVIGDGADIAEGLDAGRTRREHDHLLRQEQRLGGRLHPAGCCDVLAAETDRAKARIGACDRR